MSNLAEITTGQSTETGQFIAATSDAVFETIQEVTAAFPDLLKPEGIADLARLATHFAHGSAFRMIHDPIAFETLYRARIEAENPSEPWQQSRPRLIDGGLPDFADITAPTRSGSTLSWTVEDDFTGLPYRATVLLDALEAVELSALPLRPIPRPIPEREEEEIIDLAEGSEEIETE